MSLRRRNSSLALSGLAVVVMAGSGLFGFRSCTALEIQAKNKPIRLAQVKDEPRGRSQKQAHAFIPKIHFTPLLVSEALHYKGDLRTEPLFQRSVLQAAAAPQDARYYAEIENLEDFYNNWESWVSVAYNDVQFKDRIHMSITNGEPLRAWFGTLHAHTSVSDGEGSPEEAFTQGRKSGLDFMALTEHPEYWGHDSSHWDAEQKTAVEQTTPDFIALRGFEYSNTLGGHFAVLGSSQWTSAVRLPRLSDFYNWLASSEANGAVVFFAHPGFHPHMKPGEFHHFAFDPRLADKFVGLDVIHQNVFKRSFKGYNRKKPYLDEAIEKGWWVAPSAAQDNHYKSWGVQDNSRIGMLMPSLSEANIFAALRARRFYATNNPNLQFSVEIQNRAGGWLPMGSRIPRQDLSADKSPVLVRYADADGEEPPSHLEVVVNGAVVGEWGSSRKEKKEKEGSFWAQHNLTDLLFPNMDFRDPLGLASYAIIPRRTKKARKLPIAGEFSFELPLPKHQEGAFLSMYVRLFQGIEQKTLTVSAPIGITL